MRVDDFDFDLPTERIALRPAEPRESSRLLVVRPDRLCDHRVSNLPDLLDDGDILVYNDTRVIPARLIGRRGMARIEITLHQPIDRARWTAFARPARKCRPGDQLDFKSLVAEVVDRGDGGEIIVDFGMDRAALVDRLESVGIMPLPPYIASRRPADRRDVMDYQTIFAEKTGAVAAPTAGLHFTETLLAALDKRGIRRVGVTLHVGAGTFLPVKAADTRDHRMHAEWGEISREAADILNAARAAGGRIIPIGTTALRLLESAAEKTGSIRPFRGETDIFITPGYRFRATDRLITNFHLPRSTLFMLVCAFAGVSRMKEAYTHAIEEGYRFYSYGDACLLFPGEGYR